MQEKKWTIRQQQVIDSENEDLLVSAAAGSGKTAVLVEHVIRRILSREHPVDMDEIVVVTFTRAAAAEMRERILQAIEKEREKRPWDAHLIRQSTLVHNAQITTIDSFCGYIVRNHFHEIDLDPDYRIGEEGELKLMARSVMDEFMEEQHAMARSRIDAGERSPFLDFLDAYGRGTTDEAVVDMILQLYNKAQSYPWPKEWLRKSKESYAIGTVEELKTCPWFLEWVDDLRRQIAELSDETKELLRLAQGEDGPVFYAKGLEQDIALYESILAKEGTEELYQALQEAEFGPIGRKPRGYEGDEELLEEVKAGRADLKNRLQKLRQDFCGSSLEEVVGQMVRLRPMVEELIRLTEGFMDRFAARKRKKNVLDFSDVEHFALAILRDEKTGELRPAAREYMQQYREIIIDEYQDSNYIQEAILTSISRESMGEHNMFMVGDVKQSIYSFRQACPEIFMDKYQRYQGGEEGNRVIDLHENFRSRKEVLDFTNDVFYPLMKEDLGKIRYDEEAALHPGGIAFPEDGDRFTTELLIGEWDKEWFEQNGEDKVRWEAKLIADKIHAMQASGFCVTDKVTGELRPMQFSDVVILMRSPNKPAGDMVEVLKENGIPAFAESKTGYFNTVEVETVLHFLRILDNPRQGISMAAVLHSPIFGFTTEELALLKAGLQTETLSEALQEKWDQFHIVLDRMRRKVPELPIHQLLEELLEETGYLYYVSAMPGGESRRMNLEKLVDQAYQFEQTSLKGLFHFVHYIEECQKYEVDMGEAGRISENDNAVSILSIHKSKGLEYPVCFLAGTGRKFRKTELYQTLVIESELGVGLDWIDAEARTKEEVLYKKIISDHLKRELLGEEMRILYVALTRAREKLILTGVVEDAEATIPKWQQGERELRYFVREEAKCYLEWVIRALAARGRNYPISIISPQEVLYKEVVVQSVKKERQRLLQSEMEKIPANVSAELEKRFSYRYAYERSGQWKNKYSVSEIKHAGMEQQMSEEESERPAFLRSETKKRVPQFLSEEEREQTNPGALYGTAMHRFLECFDFAKADQITVEEQLQEMLSSGRLHKEEGERLSRDKLNCFLHTPLAERMMAAAQRKELYVETPFVMEMQQEEADSVLVQGIIDVFFVEDGQLVLLDYKTDHVERGEELVKRYKIQLQLYGEALGRGMAMPVKEMLIYSFCLDETIAL